MKLTDALHRAIHINADHYADPQAFQPERFIEHTLSASAYANSPNVNQRDHFSYGGGKCICVGMHLAERSLFNMTSCLLHVFRLGPSGSKPLPTLPEDVYTRLIMSPKDCNVNFKVRSKKIKELLERGWKNKVADIGKVWR
jgi:cytochrome P450